MTGDSAHWNERQNPRSRQAKKPTWCCYPSVFRPKLPKISKCIVLTASMDNLTIHLKKS